MKQYSFMLTLLFSIVLVPFLAACQPAQTIVEPMSSEPIVDPASWRTNTARLINISIQPNGGYANVPSGPARTPNPYATFHALKTRMLLEGNTVVPSQAKATASWLVSLVDVGRFQSEQESADTMGEIYYGVSVFSDLGVAVPTPDAFANTIDRLQHTQGPYAMSSNQLQKVSASPTPDEVLLSTQQALMTLRMLKRAPSQQPALIRWLQTSWDSMSQNLDKETSNPTTLSKLLMCLQIINPGDPRLQTGWQQVQKSLQPVLTGKSPNADVVLMDVASVVEAAQQLGIPANQWPPEAFVETLSNKQNVDGGYSVFLQGTSDMLGTQLAMQVLHYFGRTPANPQRMLELLDLHRAEAGGYFPTSKRPATLEATAAVVQSAPYLTLALDKPALTRYLNEVVPTLKTPREMYLAVQSAQTTSISLGNQSNLVDELRRALSFAVPLSRPDDLQDLYFLVSALNIVDHEHVAAMTDQIIDNLDGLRNADGSYGYDGQPSLLATSMAVLVYHELDHLPPQHQQTITWVRQQQHGGFAEPDQPALLPQTHFAMLALQALNAEPSDKDALRQWVASCLLPGGGATFSPQARQDHNNNIVWTDMALRTLAVAGVDWVNNTQVR